MRVLVVEDDAVLLDGLTAGLTLHGMTADGVSTCTDALEALKTTTFDAIVLNLTLADGSGLEMLADLRRRGDGTAVLMVAARDAVADRVRGLDAGADDYVGKPFDLSEVAARLRALRRRSVGRAAPRIDWRGLVLDLSRRTVRLHGKPVNLSRREFAILEVLLERPGVIFSKSELEALLYGWQEEVESNTVEVHIHNLRRKMGRDLIETVRGIGYRVR